MTASGVFLAGYMPKEYKSLWTAAASFVALIVAWVVAPLLGYDADTAAYSAAMTGFFQAFITYITQAQDPDEEAEPSLSSSPP